MDEDDKEALKERLNWILKYVDRKDLKSIKQETESLINEINIYGMIAPF
ncbi:hypothetical protein [Clostridium niameyense]|nr:hypothetical protein [Clostridium niameyense]